MWTSHTNIYIFKSAPHALKISSGPTLWAIGKSFSSTYKYLYSNYDDILQSIGVETLPATGITLNSVTLNGKLSSLGNYSSANVSFEWGTTSGALDQVTANQTLSATSNFSAILNGLVPGTTYYFKAVATAGEDTVYGSELSVTTASPTVTPSVTTSSATNIGASIATLHGNLDSLGTSSEVNASFMWGTVSGSLTNETAPISISSPGLFSIKLEGLTDSTTYFFKAKAVGDGTGYGNEMSFTTMTSGCFIATAAYGSYLDIHVDTLRDFRDEYLMASSIGQSFVTFYYRHSPPIAQFISEHAYLKPLVRAILMPAVVMSRIALNIGLVAAVSLASVLAVLVIAFIMRARKQRVKDSQHQQG